ncbi:MAG TPA: hypothetical protein VFQ61_28450 [Polyangiaceae bacterium]|nr:hypothetical protein [Polyangiaceae bacterium]
MAACSQVTAAKPPSQDTVPRQPAQPSSSAAASSRALPLSPEAQPASQASSPPDCIELSSPAEPSTASDTGNCSVRSARASLASVRVTVSPRESFQLRLSDVALELTPSMSPMGPVRVSARAPLAFEGTTVPPRLKLAPGTALGEGLVKAGKDVRLVKYSRVGDKVTGELEIGPYRIGPLQAPCSALRFDESSYSRADPLPPRHPLESNRTTLTLHPTVRGNELSGTPVQISESPVLNRTRQQGLLLELSLSFEDGSRLSGWAEASALHPVADGRRGGGVSEGLSLCSPGCPDGRVGRGVDGPVKYAGRARLKAQTSIHAAPDGIPWATAPTELEVELTQSERSAWVRVDRIPGIEEDSGCHALLHAFVHEANISYTKRPGGNSQ